MEPNQASEQIQSATRDSVLRELRKQGVTSLDELIAKSLNTLKESSDLRTSGGAFLGPWFALAGGRDD
jgi:hypothetical protein